MKIRPIKKSHIQWVERWIEKNIPEMQRLESDDYAEIFPDQEIDQSLPAWMGPYGKGTIMFYKNHYIHSLIVDLDPDNNNPLIFDFPEKESEFREIIDSHLKKNELCIDDDGVVFRVRPIRHARAIVQTKEETTMLIPHPKKYNGVEYFVFADGENAKQHTINRHLRNQKKITKDNNVVCGYFSYQKFPGGLFSKDLFYPIKFGFSGYYYENDYHIWDFQVITTPF